ncbi:MAG: sugar phosphate isomerase/epimerase [Desulfovibrionaceae bacterium]|nr:sugar phosphate isomerase/epimerase [Desulfovibrionaceae bacterium]MBF0513260.1 sugar phosphate isomerase/epimerase [Desulfovibrionaceae bacterium]
MFFVNLALRALHREPSRLDSFADKRLNPELGMDPLMLDSLPPAWHRETAGRIADAGLACSVHLPFFDLQPGSVDPLVLAAARTRLRQAVDTAAIYQPRHLIAHAAYDRFLYIHSYQDWRDRAARSFALALEGWPEHPPLFLENTHETNPVHVAGLADALAELSPGPVRTGICFDLGHWFSFGQGCVKKHLAEWFDVFAPHLGHLHLHDNDGAFDQHLGLGRGGIPWEAVFGELARRSLTPTVTFEPHTPEDIEHTLEFAAEHPDWFARLGAEATGA